MYYFVIIFILSANLHQICGKTTISQTIGDNILYAACGRLCDKPDIEAIAPLSVPTDEQFLVIIVRDGLCSWVMDMNEPKQNRDWGRKHHFKYDFVESLYTIFDDPKSSDKLNVTAFFTSGMVSETWRSVGGYIKKDSEGPLPLMGLPYNMQKEIDASFGSQPDPQTRIVYIIQNDTYYGFNLKTKKMSSGPKSLTKDYSYDFKRMGPIQGAFRRGFDIHFFCGKNGYYIWKSKDGKTGYMSEKLSVTKDFYNCGTRYTTPKYSTGTQETTDRFKDKETDDTSVDLISDDLTTDVILQTRDDSIQDSDKNVVPLKGDISDDLDVNVEPMTLDPKSDSGVEDKAVLSGSDHKVLLSYKLSIILVVISILEYFSI